MSDRRLELLLIVLAMTAPAAALEPGDLDPTFGDTGTTPGVAIKASTAGIYERAHDLARAPGGGFLVATMNVLAEEGYVRKFDEDGTWDTTFGVGGRIFLPDDVRHGVFLTVDLLNDKIYVGTTVVSETVDADEETKLYRYDADGDLEAAQVVPFDLGGSDDDELVDLLHASGRIYLLAACDGGGAGNVDFGLRAMETDLGPDFGYNSGLPLRIAFDLGGDDADRPEKLILDDGRVVVVGSATTSTGWQAAMARVVSTGALDPAFSGDGRLTFAYAPGLFEPTADETFGRDLVALDDGGYRIVAQAEVPGDASALEEVVLAAVKEDGAPDLEWGTIGYRRHGYSIPLHGDADDLPVAAAWTPYQTLVVAGTSRSSSGSVRLGMISRHVLPFGTLDSDFGGGDGQRLLAASPTLDDTVEAVLWDSGDVVYLAGTTNNGTDDDVFVAKLVGNDVFRSAFEDGGLAEWSASAP